MRLPLALLVATALAAAPAQAGFRTRSSAFTAQLADAQTKRLGGDASGAAAAFEEAARQARVDGDDDGQWEALLEAANARRDAQEAPTGVVDAFQALQVAQRGGDPIRIGRTQLFLAGMYGHAKDLTNALLYYDAAATTFGNAGEQGLSGMARLAAGDAASAAGSWKDAADWYQRTALTFHGPGGMAAMEAASLQRAAIAWARAGVAGHAGSSAISARFVAKSARAEPALLVAFEAAGDVSREAGRVPEAISLWDEGTAEAKRQGSSESVRFTLRIASATWKSGDRAKAESLLGGAEDDAAKAGDVARLGRIAAVRGALLADGGDYANARPMLESAERKLAGGDPSDRGTAQEALGLCLAATGDWNGAEAAFTRAAASFEAGGEPEGQVRALAKGMLAQAVLGQSAAAKARGEQILAINAKEGVSVSPTDLSTIVGLAAKAMPAAPPPPPSNPNPPQNPVVSNSYSPPIRIGLDYERSSIYASGAEATGNGATLSLRYRAVGLTVTGALTDRGPSFYEGKFDYETFAHLGGPFSLKSGLGVGYDGMTNGAFLGDFQLRKSVFVEYAPTLSVHISSGLGLHLGGWLRWAFQDGRSDIENKLITDAIKVDDLGGELRFTYWATSFGLHLGYRVNWIGGSKWKTGFLGVSF